jgi:hypothetical protein
MTRIASGEVPEGVVVMHSPGKYYYQSDKDLQRAFLWVWVYLTEGYWAKRRMPKRRYEVQVQV